MFKFPALLLLLFFVLSTSCSNEKKPVTVDSVDLAKIEKQATVSLGAKKIHTWLSSGGDSLTILYFYADWCKICQKFRPQLLNAITGSSTSLRTGIVNSDQQKAAISEFGITSLPTIKFYKNNRLLYTSVGFLQETELQKLIIKFAKM